MNNIVFGPGEVINSIKNLIDANEFYLFGLSPNIHNVEYSRIRTQHKCMILIKDKTIDDNVVENFISNNVISVVDGYEPMKLVKQIKWIANGCCCNKSDNAKTWFTSDTHFSHYNIIKYCSRPFKTADEMNDVLIKKWNSVVGKDDIVWHLGDFALGPNQTQTIPEFVKKLNGKINLVLGNHDHHSVKFYYDAGFNRVYDRSVIINDFIILSHAPKEFVKGPFFNIFGHVHDCATYNTWSKDSCCVCVERHDYKPVSLEEIKKQYDMLNI